MICNRLSNKVSTSHAWLFKLKLTQIEENCKFGHSAAPATLEVCHSHMRLVGPALDS